MTTWTQVLASAFDEPPPRQRRVALPRGAVLRLDNARGVCVRVTAGRVWLTEERCPYDVVLARNGSHPIASRGRVVAAAERASRVAIEWPAAAAAPHVEIAQREGGAGRRLPGLSGRFAWLAALLGAWWSADPRVDASSDVSPEAVRDRLAAHVPLLRG